jgi:hypothetical protein
MPWDITDTRALPAIWTFGLHLIQVIFAVRQRLCESLVLQFPNLSNLLSAGEFIGIGNAPLRIEILTSISGVNFAECYQARTTAVIDDVEINLIGLEQLKENKQASGRMKDINDLQNLPKFSS